jgi:hypothetical protein
MAEIREAQNAEDNLRNRIAANGFYNQAKWFHFGGTSVALLLALASPFVLVYRPDWGPAIGAIGGAWIFASRVLLDRFTRELKLYGATAQERFDCSVLGLDWNDALAHRLSDEEIHKASRKMKNREGAKDWYPADGDDSWPRSVLICQRTNAVWARRQHRAYSRMVVSAAVALFVVGVLVAINHSASLSDYLVTILLPSLPAFLDTSDLARAHAAASSARRLVEEQTDTHLQSGAATYDELREIQDQMFNLRREAPLVPGWFYTFIRPGYEEDMRFAAQRSSRTSDD